LLEMVSFPLGEPGRLPFSWTSLVMSDMAAEDPKPPSWYVSFRNNKRGMMAMKVGKLWTTA
jgi:hypothetical protein